MKLFALMIIASFLTLAQSDIQNSRRYINVIGTSQLIINADQIEFKVQIKMVEPSAEKSKNENVKNTDELLSILNSSGISSSEIEVKPMILGKNFVFDKERQRKHDGFFTLTNVSFTLKDISKYFELMTRITKSDIYEILSSNYKASDYELHHRKSYENALLAAKEKAEYMAKTLGISLGDILEIEENPSQNHYPNPFNNVTVENSQSGEISGKVPFTRSIRVKFEIK